MGNHDSEEQRVWERNCPEAITSDIIWKLDAYRAALFFLYLARGDCRVLGAARPGDGIASQLLRASGSVSANLAEGYSRSTRADRLRFLGYALGSLRECISWYEAARDGLPDAVTDERLTLLNRIRSLLLGLIRAMRGDSSITRFEH
jgi:four helix bundle protein